MEFTGKDDYLRAIVHSENMSGVSEDIFLKLVACKASIAHTCNLMKHDRDISISYLQ